jgi:plasmid stability protein
MVAITIKNIPDELYESLKNAANAHHRSINNEIIACLEMVLLPTRCSIENHLHIARSLRAQVKANKLDHEEINRAKHEGRP